MLKLFEILSGVVSTRKKFDVKKLPSQGLFYKDDFSIHIKKADIKDIIIYEQNYIKDDLGVIINQIKKIVKNNTYFSNDYIFDDLKSVDVIFLFLEIVKFTNNKSIEINYLDDETGASETIEFKTEYFNYHKITELINSNYDKNNKQFVIDGYQFTLPSIGVENCLTNFLINKNNRPDSSKYNNYNYDFTYFLGDKNKVTFSEIENLIQIFNFDLDKIEKEKVKRIIDTFQPLQKYSLVKNNKIIDINSKIDLEKIWK
jgi:hypothetical protein